MSRWEPAFPRANEHRPVANPFNLAQRIQEIVAAQIDAAPFQNVTHVEVYSAQPTASGRRRYVPDRYDRARPEPRQRGHPPYLHRPRNLLAQSCPASCRAARLSSVIHCATEREGTA